MSRPRAFDEDEALDSAIDCFWQQGLEATSVRDLASQMGINAPSLYNTFGGKRALFALALERYATRSMRERIQRLEANYAPKDALNAFCREIVDRSVADRNRRGCLIVNAALEVAPHDRELRVIISGYLGEIEGFFGRCISRAQMTGDVPRHLDPRDTARLLLGIVLGIRVAARAKPDRTLLEGMLRPALATLDLPTRKPTKGKQ